MMDDLVRLKHILDACTEALSYTRGLDKSDIAASRPLQHSLVRCIEVIGEAASKITPEFRAAHESLPWQDMVRMRNRLIHAYHDVDLDIVWSTVTAELPKVAREVKTLLGTDDA